MSKENGGEKSKQTKQKLPVSPTYLTSSDTQLSNPFKSMLSTLRMQTVAF